VSAVLPRLLVVTDPMCSWCWGMSSAVEGAAQTLAGDVAFDLLLGGINTSSTRPVGDYGGRLLMRIWRDVHATTGQAFSFRLPEGLVYNSTRACLAVAAVRRKTGKAPFGYLHRLQQLLFAEGRNTGDPELLARTAEEFGVPAAVVRAGLDDPRLQDQLRAEFAGARIYGTQALPNLLLEVDGRRRLLAGGYVDAAMLVSLVRGALG
jgi:putative protein-disulfide isomerase